MIEHELRRIIREEVHAEIEKLLVELRGPTHADSGEKQPHYLTVAEAAKVTGVSAGTIRSWVSRGELTAHRAGRRIRIRQDELRAYLARQQEEPQVDEEERIRAILREVG